MTRYLLAVNFQGGVVDTPMDEWKPEEIAAHLDYYKILHNELVNSGELVDSTGGRRAEHGRDRQRLPRAGGDDGAAHRSSEAAHQGVGCAVRDPQPRRVGGQTAQGAARAVSDLQRGLRREQQPRPATPRVVG
jgi:hypothetical protein